MQQDGQKGCLALISCPDTYNNTLKSGLGMQEGRPNSEMRDNGVLYNSSLMTASFPLFKACLEFGLLT